MFGFGFLCLLSVVVSAVKVESLYHHHHHHQPRGCVSKVSGSLSGVPRPGNTQFYLEQGQLNGVVPFAGQSPCPGGDKGTLGVLVEACNPSGSVDVVIQGAYPPGPAQAVVNRPPPGLGRATINLTFYCAQ